MNENETNAAPIVPPTSASGCSKSESDTPRTDTFYDDHLDFGHYESDEWYKFASQLERELSIAVAAAAGSSAPACSVLRPTEYEIDLEARQWAEEYAENTQITRQEIFAAGARWARGVARFGGPNP